jgi:hypothetical protein
LPKHISVYWEEAQELFPPGKVDFNSLYDLLSQAIYEFNNVGIEENSASSLIGDIAKDLQRKLGLITRQVG